METHEIIIIGTLTGIALSVTLLAIGSVFDNDWVCKIAGGIFGVSVLTAIWGLVVGLALEMMAK